MTRAIRARLVACACDRLECEMAQYQLSHFTWNKKSGIHEANKV
jgi:hypothetical protein